MLIVPLLYSSIPPECTFAGALQPFWVDEMDKATVFCSLHLNATIFHLFSAWTLVGLLAAVYPDLELLGSFEFCICVAFVVSFCCFPLFLFDDVSTIVDLCIYAFSSGCGTFVMLQSAYVHNPEVFCQKIGRRQSNNTQAHIQIITTL